MNVLFLCSQMSLGGIETLILRMAQTPLDNKFAFLFLRKPKKRNLMNALKAAPSLVIEDINVLLLIFFKYRKNSLFERLKKFGINKIDCIYVFNMQSLVLAACLQTIFTEAKICMGVYHFNEYLWEFKPTTYMQSQIYKIIYQLPDDNIFFMNKGTKNINRRRLSNRFSASPIVSIPLDLRRFGQITRSPSKFKIISVGRLVRFKNYNFHLIPIVKELHQADSRVTYHIYGYGDREGELLKAIHEQKAGHCVFFHGPVSYDQYPEVLRDAYVFVGCGTALFEAAAAGVPSLIGPFLGMIEATYGWTCDQLDSDFGEYDAEKPLLKYKDLLTSAFSLDDASYEILSQETRVKVSPYNAEAVMKQFTEYWKKARFCKLSIPRWSLLRFIASYVFANKLAGFGFSPLYNNRYHNNDFLDEV